MNQSTPLDYGIPHSSWRACQHDALNAATELRTNGGGFLFSEMGTGTGKTAVACGLGHGERVLYVCQSLALLDQAERLYGFAIVKGRQEYDCVLETKVEKWRRKYGRIPKASDCHFAKMGDCPVLTQCPYHRAKEAALAARRSACTYRYLALSYNMQKRGGTVVLDECHLAAEEILGFATFEMGEPRRKQWGLSNFPYSDPYGPDGRGDILSLEARDTVGGWLLDCIGSLRGIDPDSEYGAKAKRLKMRLQRQLEDLPTTNWFLECGEGTVTRTKWDRGRATHVQCPGLRLRALDARPVASRLWKNKNTVLLMSATIGSDPSPLARELGIDDFKFVSYPHPIPIEARPVYDLDMGRMTHKNLRDNPTLYKIQATKIQHFVESLDPEWRGVILTSSNKKVGILRRELGASLGRIFQPPNTGPAGRLAAFLADTRLGLIMVDTAQGLGHGVDLWGDAGRFAIVAGIPFDNPSDPFSRARDEVMGSNKYRWWKSYMSVPQMCGRVSRGEKDDDGEWLLNVAALADGSAVSPKALRSYPKWFRDAIIR